MNSILADAFRQSQTLVSFQLGFKLIGYLIAQIQAQERP